MTKAPKKTMVRVEEALGIITSAALHQSAETIAIENAIGRVCANDIIAAITHPPFDSSAMDGYALKISDTCRQGARLTIIGDSPAGSPFDGELKKGQAVRVFTGSVIPSGANHVIMQENVTRVGDSIIIDTAASEARNFRRSGTDFRAGEIIKAAGQTISPIDATLLAGANIATLAVIRRPVIAYFDNGDELIEPGMPLGAGQIIGSNRFAIDDLIRDWGGQPHYLGRAKDSLEAVRSIFEKGVKADLIVPIGGASVGDHDYVRPAFAASGGALAFQKIAVKPRKPTWFGQLGKTHVLGLPGNPASAIVCAILFLRPLIKEMLGQTNANPFVTARLDTALPNNGPRETYQRATLNIDTAAQLSVTPVDLQDSSLMSRLARANCLIKCPPHMAALKKGDMITCLPYGKVL